MMQSNLLPLYFLSLGFLPNESEAEFQSSLQGLLYELDSHKLIRYQRNAISRLSKAIRPA